MRRTLQTIVVGSALLLSINSAITAQACPMCKGALAQDDDDPVAVARPKAYMYSILFMLSMPATLTMLFGVSFYRMSKQQQAMNAVLLAEQAETSADNSDFSA